MGQGAKLAEGYAGRAVLRGAGRARSWGEVATWAVVLDAYP